jgi:nucleotide-binding universal stress UspA family protein
MITTSNGPVVIGIDDSRSSTNAMQWGLALAERHAVPVRLVRSYEGSVVDNLLADRRGPGSGTDHIDKAGEQLEEARERAAAGHPKLLITASLVRGSAAAALIDESREASAIVIGSHGANAFSTLVAGATTMNVATQAWCPVVSVPTEEARAFGGTGIVVGVDGGGPSEDALRFAFREADDTHAPLTAVFAWMGSPWPVGTGLAGLSEEDLSRRLRAARERLNAWVAPWAKKFPDVVVSQRVMHEHPVRALAAASSGAQLLVVGCRGSSGVGSLLLGSVSHGVLHLATSPVAVVHQHS